MAKILYVHTIYVWVTIYSVSCYSFIMRMQNMHPIYLIIHAFYTLHASPPNKTKNKLGAVQCE